MQATPREARCPGYRRRDPTRSLFYELVREHLETFLDELSPWAGPGLPRFVKRELRRYLECGVLAHGFVRVHCPACQRDSLVAFSCKGRGFCPSCCGRRMSATAAHLVDHVLPETPMRQWVLTLPFPLRLRCAFDRELCTAVRRCFIASVSAHLARHARARGIPPGAKGFRSGAVNVIQRYGGALNLNVHFHALFIDGVYTRDDPLATARFHELPAPSQEDVEWTLARVHSRIQRLLARIERRLDPEALPEDEALLARLASASVRGRQATGAHRDEPLAGLFTPPTASRPATPPVLLARGAGFSLHAGVAVAADRRGRLEHLCRYITRPPLAAERLSLDEQGRILLRLRHPHADGKTHVVFTPRTLLERLCALVPRPRAHQVTYHGVLASASTFRDDVVPTPTHGVRARAGAARALSLDRRLRWAELMKRTFDLDLLRCECGARREVIACILEPAVARRILIHLGLPHEQPASTPSRAPPVLEFV